MEAELIGYIGEQAYLTLLEYAGGVITYIPQNIQNTNLSLAIGSEAAQKLSEKLGGSHITVPLSKAFRIHQYKAMGLNNKQICVKLCITETGLYRHLRNVS